MKNTVTKFVSVMLAAMMIAGAAPVSISAFAAAQTKAVATVDTVEKAAAFEESVLPKVRFSELRAASDTAVNSVSDGDEVVASGSCGDTAVYTLTADGTLTVGGTGEVKTIFEEYGTEKRGELKNAVKKAVFEEGITKIGLSFELLNVKKVELPSTVSDFSGTSFIYCISLTEVNVSKDNPYYMSENGIVFTKDRTTLVKYPEGKTDKEYTVPDTVKTIGEYAFCFANSGSPDSVIGDDYNGILKKLYDNPVKITLPNSVEKIAMGAFYIASVRELVIPESVTVVETYGLFCLSDKITVLNRNTALDMYSKSPAVSKMYGYTGSTAEEYAECYGIGFESLDDLYVTEMKIETMPGKTEFWETEEFESYGLTVSVTYSDGSTAVKRYGFKTSGYDRTKYGKNTITVTYKGFTVTYDVTVKEVPEVKLGDTITLEKGQGKVWVKFTAPAAKAYRARLYSRTPNDGYWRYDCTVYDSTLDEGFAIRMEFERIPVKAGETCYARIICSEDYTAEFKIECYDCDWNAITGTNPTCTEAGHGTFKCTVCGKVSERDVAALGHNYESTWTVDVAATCTDNGVRSRHCTRCDKKIDIGEIYATGHTDSDKDGRCDVCGASQLSSCKHMCHSDNKLSQFFWKMLRLLYKLFRTNEFCECGAKHW